MEEITLLPPTPAEIEKYKNWWDGLSSPWKKAYNEVYLRQSTEDQMPDDLVHSVWHAPALRFAGPTAMYPNMSFELDDLTGVAMLPAATVLVVAHHQIKSLEPIAQMQQLESLFVFNNQISDLSPVAGLSKLREFYFQCNLVTSLKPLEHLTALETIYCSSNQLTSLEGIGEQHGDNLKQFMCLPNEHLRDRDVMKFEREIGIRCLKG